MVDAVLFDYGLVLSGPADPVAWAQMKAIAGLPEEQFHAAYWAPRHDYDRGASTGAAYWQAVGDTAGIGLDQSQIAALLAADVTLWTRLNDPMVAWAARLQAAGTKTGILSNLGDALTEGVLATHPWLGGFGHRVFSHALGIAKPEVAIYRHAAAVMGLAPATVLFIDDREENCAGAVAAGMQIIRYSDHAAFLQEMKARGWGELWRAGKLQAR